MRGRPGRAGRRRRGTRSGRAWPYLPNSRRAGIIDASSRPWSPMLRMRGPRQPRGRCLPASPQLPRGWGGGGAGAAPDGVSPGPKLLPEAAVSHALRAGILLPRRTRGRPGGRQGGGAKEAERAGGTFPARLPLGAWFAASLGCSRAPRAAPVLGGSARRDLPRVLEKKQTGLPRITKGRIETLRRVEGVTRSRAPPPLAARPFSGIRGSPLSFLFRQGVFPT